jgi:lipopolysaccharide/colanic/teichoic acid biosynthesis glycosyltransferase
MKSEWCARRVHRSVAVLQEPVASPRPAMRKSRLRVYSVDEFHAALERERARVDRNGHCLSVVLVPSGGGDDGALSTEETIEMLVQRARLTDEVGWFDRFWLGLLMPYTSPEAARSVVQSLCRLSDGKLSASDCSVYVYPGDEFFDEGNGSNGEDGGEDLACKDTKPSWVEGLTAQRGVLQKGPVDTRLSVGSVPEGWVPPCHGLIALLEKGPVMGQRALDIVCALVGLVVTMPILLLAALMIKIVSPGPVFLRQTRIGQGGKPFVLWKLRTMNVGADPAIHQRYVAQLIRSAAASDAGNSKPMAKLDSHPDLIAFGNVLRKLCVDELPQLINVLRGEMSLVGPRPALPYEVKEYLPWQRSRLDAMPGMTGLWQVSGKNKLTFNEMVRLDIRYARQQSLWLNVRIIWRTPHAIVRQVLDTWVNPKVGVGELDHA